ncbi:hypothetical protein FACS189460_3600 [Deltaproteobacteria bacterium]|nr:hypothetical protein FACS189460_3600 [Deltaproteobacteria bacterium]
MCSVTDGIQGMVAEGGNLSRAVDAYGEEWLRLQAEMTQKKLAEAIGVHQSHVSEYEKNKRKIPEGKAKPKIFPSRPGRSYFRGPGPRI